MQIYPFPGKQVITYHCLLGFIMGRIRYLGSYGPINFNCIILRVNLCCNYGNLYIYYTLNYM